MSSVQILYQQNFDNDLSLELLLKKRQEVALLLKNASAILSQLEDNDQRIALLLEDCLTLLEGNSKKDKKNTLQDKVCRLVEANDDRLLDISG
jgi:hypothetical protein